MKLLDYIFYKISRPYVNGFFIAPHPEMWASMVFAVIIFLNLFSLAILFKWPPKTFEILVGGLFFLIMTFFHFRYSEKRLDELEKKYRKENETQKLWGGIAVFTWVFGSIFFLFWLIW